MARTEEELYDAYLDRCLDGDAEAPEAFCARHPDVGNELRMRIEAIYRMHVQAPGEAPPFERLGEFRLVRRLDAGGMGTIYLAEQQSLGRQVALKVLRSELRGSDTAAERFRRETRAAARLKHPNIVQVFAAGEENGVRYLAMELVEGRNLDAVLGSEDRPRWRTATAWTRDLAHALQHAHDAGIVHRDVKPTNIRVTPDGRPRLFDFGIARDVEAGAGLTQTYAGSPLYSAPEQLMGRELDGRADVYALGIVLYEMLTGRGPFAGGSMEQVLRRCLAEQPLPPRRLDPSLPRDLDTVVLKAIEKEPRARYATAADFAADLEAVLEDRPIQARPPSRMTQAARWLRRRPAVGVALLAVVGVAVLLTVLAWRDRRVRADEAAGLVARCDGLGAELESDRERSLDLERAVAVLQAYVATRYLEDDETRRLREGEIEVRRLRRAREEKFHEALALLRRAERLDPDVVGTAAARARLYQGRAREARRLRDPATERFWIDLAEAEDADQPYDVARRDVAIRTDPPGAEVMLWQLRERADRRIVPMPAPVQPGTWALRVRGEDWLIIEVEGKPVAVGTTARGKAKIVRDGRIETVTLPPALDVRLTAAPAFPAPERRVGVTPVTVSLEQGNYLATLRHPDREPVRIAFRAKDGLPVIELPAVGSTPPGFVFVHAKSGDFRIMEREVTCGEYLDFLKANPERPGPRAAHNADRGGFWPERKLPSDWSADWPVFGVSYADAEAYVAWKNREAPAAFEYALPTYEEWVRAGRGTSGRTYPFGHAFWPKWMNSNYSKPQPSPEPVMSYPVDESPLGVYDMAGGVHEWLATPYGSDPAFRRIGGGAWGEAKPEHFRLENGLGMRMTLTSTQTGFRLVLRRRK